LRSFAANLITLILASQPFDQDHNLEYLNHKMQRRLIFFIPSAPQTDELLNREPRSVNLEA
jgi:hypothetical protein